MPSFVSSLRSFSKLAFTSAQIALISTGQSTLGGSPPTCTNPQTSCQNTTVVQDLCCFNAPGGQLLQTQFWDYSPSTGPSNSWTIHGLWPDHCDGTFDANCDPSRAYTDIRARLTSYGATDLLSYMDTYWKDYQGNDEQFWAHEWGKHGTCISTLNPSCYTNYAQDEDVVDFFQKTVDLFKTLPSYQWLSDAGIVPSTSQTYASADILAALKKNRGVDVAIQCKSGALDEIWYFYDVAGSIQTGDFIPTNPDGAKSNCPASGIKYVPKTGSPVNPPPVNPPPTTTSTTATTTTTTTDAAPSPTDSAPVTPPGNPSNPGAPFAGRGSLQVSTGGSPNGCIISSGTWYTSGTCATFTATASGSSGFTLTSSKGPCGIVSNTLTCGSGVTATEFTSSDADGGALAYNGAATFYAAAVASGSTQEKVGVVQDAVGLLITWSQ